MILRSAPSIQPFTKSVLLTLVVAICALHTSVESFMVTKSISCLDARTRLNSSPEMVAQYSVEAVTLDQEQADATKEKTIDELVTDREVDALMLKVQLEDLDATSERLDRTLADERNAFKKEKDDLIELITHLSKHVALGYEDVKNTSKKVAEFEVREKEMLELIAELKRELDEIKTLRKR